MFNKLEVIVTFFKAIMSSSWVSILKLFVFGLLSITLYSIYDFATKLDKQVNNQNTSKTHKDQTLREIVEVTETNTDSIGTQLTLLVALLEDLKEKVERNELALLVHRSEDVHN